jgi:FixJ family two-component response regulator
MLLLHKRIADRRHRTQRARWTKTIRSLEQTFHESMPMSEYTPTVFVVEDDPAIRDAIDSLLRSAGLCVRLFPSAQYLLAELRQDDAGCLVLDVRLPGVSGLELQQEILKKDIRIPTIFLTAHGDVRMSVQAIKAGAVEFLTKPINDLDLLNAVHQSIEKDRIDRKGREELSHIRKRFEELTPREREIMQLVVSGLLNKQIAGEVGISEITVKIHRGHVMHKMGARSLAELTRMSEQLTSSTPHAQRSAGFKADG